MELILEEDIKYKTPINDFGVEPINKRIITTGEKLIYFNKEKFEKESGGKVKNCEIIKYIKEKNQLFVSSMFFVSTPNGKVYKCDGNKKKIVELVFDIEDSIGVMNFITSGRIVYIKNNDLFSYDVDTKELISSVLARKYKTQYTFGNLNNHIGVPLTLLSITKEHEIAVIEMGANHQKEIELLCSLAEPNIGYITNFGKAHLEGFGGFEGVIKGKSELYDYLKENNQTILVNEADEIQREKTKNYSKKITFGSGDSQFYFEKFVENNLVGIIYKGQKIQSNLTGDYNFTNICAAVSLGLHFDIDFEEIKSAIENYKPTNMRSQVVEKNGKTLVLDTYNANPSSMALSLNNFSQFTGSKTVIIGDMLELGEESITEHQKIWELAQSLNLDEIITVGSIFKQVNPSEKSFKNTDELIEYLKQNPIKNKNILLKGSRGIALEKVIEFL